ncbi:MAG: homoserine kinase [Coriobacteriia bacterium]|nr:homoserine kinase [Coriobacteriia bacterium]
MRIGVSVPATSANLGPGYDSFGLALGLYNEVEGELAEQWNVEIGGEGAGGLPAGPDNLVAHAMSRVFAEAGHPELKADIACHNGIPVARGLGSSAAAIVGGLVLGNALTGGHLDEMRLLRMAVELEGHSDNVTAALRGGFTVTSGAGGDLTSAHVDPAGGFAVLAVIGEAELSTPVARNVIPESVPHADAASNAARAALVALGMATGSPEYLQAGLHDAIHEPYRRELIPDLEAVRSLLEAIGAGRAVLSGTGPTMVSIVQGLTDERALERARALSEVARTALDGIGRGRVLALPIDRVGARQL